MIPLDLSGKVALITGVGDNVGFAWHIAKTLQAAGARLFFAVHPRLGGHRREHSGARTGRPFAGAALRGRRPPRRESHRLRRGLRHDGRRGREDPQRPPLRQAGRLLDPGNADDVQDRLQPNRHSHSQRRLQPRGHEPGHRHQPQSVPHRPERQLLFADRAPARLPAADGKPAGRGQRRGLDVPRRLPRRAALRRRHVLGQGGASDRRDAAGQQPGAEEHPRQPDLGRPLRLARPPPSARAITPSTR